MMLLPPKLSAKLRADGDSALNPAVKQQLFMWNWRASLDRARPKNSSKRWKTFSEKTNSGVPCFVCLVKPSAFSCFQSSSGYPENHTSLRENHYKTPFPHVTEGRNAIDPVQNPHKTGIRIIPADTARLSSTRRNTSRGPSWGYDSGHYT